MAAGQPPTGPSAAKLGGVALIGVGALAAVFGVATAVSGEPDSVAKSPGGGAAGPTTSAVSRAPSSEAAAPSQDRHSAAPSPTSKPPTSPGQPGPAPRPGSGSPDKSGGADGRRQGGSPESNRQPGGAGAGVDRPATQRQIVLRVYNNSKIRGLAHRAAADFRAAGYRVAEIDNYSGGRIPVTTIYYRPGTAEQAQARIVADRFGARLEPRFPGIRNASPGVIAIVTKNYDGPEPGK